MLLRKSHLPRIKILSKSDEKIEFILSETNTAVANSLRRILLAEVPTLAIEDVEIEENSTALFDELIVHRLGFIPLKCDLSTLGTFKFPNQCDCEEGQDVCTKCRVVFTLDVGLSATSRSKLSVTSSDLKSSNLKVEPITFISQDERNMAKEQGILICKIGPGQRLKLRCVAKKGIGKVHAKWQPVATAVFQHEPSVELNRVRLSQLNEEQKTKLVKCCPTKVFTMDKTTQQVKVEPGDHLKCVMCDECLLFSDSVKTVQSDAPVVEIGRVPQRFYFTVETTGALKPEDIVLSGIRVLQQKLREVSEVLEKLPIKRPDEDDSDTDDDDEYENMGF